MRIEIYYCQGKCSVRKKQGPLKIWNSRDLSFARKYKHSREYTITMEIQDDDEISTEKVGTSGHIYLLGVCGIWLPWRPETYIIRQAARKRSENTFGGVA